MTGNWSKIRMVSTKNEELLAQNPHDLSENDALLAQTFKGQSENDGLLAQKSKGQGSQGQSEK